MAGRGAALGIAAVLFDKDGCLCDFAGTWNLWAAGQIAGFARGDAGLEQALARSLRYDLAARAFLPDSPVIAGTNRDTARCIQRVLPELDLDETEARIAQAAQEVRIAEVIPLAPYLAGLLGHGLRLGVVTNDAEAVARAQLRACGCDGAFGVITGADSGHGAKPLPGPLLASAAALGVAPDRVLMVGDSLHDIHAGRAAGMRTAGVLTGLASAEDLAPVADVVLPDIAHLPGWLGLGQAGA